jgi:glycosyltransferase involved in cell wall biosynthesis
MARESSDRAIDLAVAGKFHAFHLATEFSKLSRLRDLYAAHRQFSPPVGLARSAYHNRIDLAAWAALSRFGPLGYSGERKSAIFDRWLRRSLMRKTPAILHAWNGNSRDTFKALKGTEWLLCVERSCPHNQFQFNLLVEEGNEIGIPHHQDMRALDNAIEELHLADIIVAPSLYSARSYTDPQLIRKVRVNPLGGNVRYMERPNRRNGLRILMVGNSFLRKGTHYLVEAMQYISDPNAELWIRGDVPEKYKRRIKDSRITILPPLLPSRLRSLYMSADVFVQPSVDEGFGMTVLEALGYGLPLVITENVGAADLLNDQVCIKVPIRNSRALADGIEAARLLPKSKFDLAREAIIGTCTWAACANRMLTDVYLSPSEPSTNSGVPNSQFDEEK